MRKADKSFQDDYSNILPIYKYNELTVATMLTPEMDRTIQKSAKLIKTHSITVKPKLDKKKKLSTKDREFLNKPEYCNWIDDAYLIMGQAHYFKREFITAEQTFLLIMNKFKKEPIKYDAKLWLAKTKIETADYEDAQTLLKELKRASKKPKSMNQEINLVYADMNMKQKNYKNAIDYLKKSIKNEKEKKFRTRLIFILAQLYNKEENYKDAIVNFRLVIKNNPSYDMTFSAKIKLAEIYEKTKSDGKDLKKELLKMLKDDKNIDYLDQIYYALGRIELNDKNIPEAMEYFRLSASANSSSKNQKVKTFMVLADYYGKKGNYQLASPYYDSTVNLMEKSFPDYEVLYPKMNSYAKLMQQLNIISTQDSLQKVAKLPENERNKIIDKLIKKIVDAEQAAASANQTTNNSYDPFMNDRSNNFNQNQPKGGGWYFYNPQTVSYGQTEFKKRWGDRKLEDLWRLNNKKMLAEIDVESDEQNNEENNDQDDNQTTKLSNKTREFYINDLPLTDEKIAESNKKIQTALLQAGVIYADELDEKKNAIDILELLLQRYPQTEKRLDALQLLFNTSTRNADYSRANKYKNLIITEYPESLNAKILSDPNYLSDQKRKGEEVEELYSKTYSYFNNKKYDQAINLCNRAIKDYSDDKLSANFQFIKALSYGELGNKSKLKEELELLVLEHPNAEISANAKKILLLIDSGKYNEKLYTFEPDSLHYYVIVAPNNKVDFNKLKFSYLSFNVDNYNQLDLKAFQIELDMERTMIVIQQFENSNDAKLYYQQLINKKVLGEYSSVPFKHFIISNNNYKKYIKDQSTEKYLTFFDENYSN
ncbi:MAG: tetratricopeptide repeat protein [Bacteroidota bacterium]